MLIYMDDFVLHTPTIEEHEQLLEEVFRRLAEAKLQISLAKSSFFTRSASFLGFVISNEGVIPDPKKTEALLGHSAPSTLEGVRSTLGTFNMFRKHIKGYAEIVRPINEITRGHPVGKGKNIKITWTAEADRALKLLKEATAKSAMLKFPDFT